MVGLIVFGAIAFSRLGVSQLPDVDFPVVTVSLTYEGASPEVMETDVVDVVEDAVMTVQGIKTVSSQSRYGSATVTLEFNLDRDIEAALQEVQTKMGQVQKRLPKEMDPPVVTKTNPEDQPIMWLTVSSDRHTQRELMLYVRDQLKDKFSTVAGVGEVFLGGYTEPNLRVWINNEKLRAYELTVGDVLNTVQDEHMELPAGQIETDRREYDVRTLGEAKTIGEFGDIVINERGGRPNYVPVLLKQVAKIEEGLAEVRRTSRFNGVPALGLGIRKQRGSNAVAVARDVKQRATEIQKDLPPGMKVALNFDTTRFIEESVGELNFTLILSAILTGIVCWLFLGSWSSTINVLMAIPTSIIGAFLGILFFGFTLNTFTLLGLSLAIGIVVDDAIMVLENIVRHKEMGKTRLQAALDGSKEITFAAMAASVAIIAIFLPVVFMRGVIGKFFLQFGVTMTITVALSLLEALTLTPMRCSQFLDTGERTSKIGRFMEKSFHRSADGYRRILSWALHRRWTTLILAVLFFVASIFSFKFLNKEFVPAQDQSIFMVRLQTPVDSSLNYTDGKLKEVEAFLSQRPEVERFYAAVGGFGGGEVNTGMVFVTMKDRKKRKVSQQDFMATCRKELSKIKDLKVTIQDLSMRGFSSSRGYPIEFSVRGPEWEKLAEISQNFTDKLEKTGLVVDVDTNYRLGKPEIRILPDRSKAAMHGVSIRAISETVNAMIGGLARGKYAMGGHRYDIRVKLEANGEDRRKEISGLFVRNNRGELVRLSDLVKIEEKPSLQLISRFDRERAVSIFANIKPGASQAKAMEAIDELAKKLPDHYHVVSSGSSQSFKESFQDLVFALVLGILVAYMVLASQFNSFLDPVLVLLALPFSVSGAFLALFISSQSVNIYSFIGLILLMGIVKKNSILLVEFTNQVHEQDLKKSVDEALLEACPIRLRPILMTSLATIAGAIPPALAVGPGAETRVPMAICVIGGVLVSTVLTLIVVPSAYSLASGLKKKVKHA